MRQDAAESSAEEGEDDAGEDAEDGGEFLAPVVFAEEENAAGESDKGGAAAKTGNDGDERVGIAQGVEVEEVGDEQGERHEDDAWAPVEFVALPQAEFPAEGERKKEEREVNGEPGLDGGGVETVMAEKVFVVEGADAVEHGAEDEEPDPAVAAEVDALALASGGEAEEGGKGDGDAETLEESGALTKDQEGAGDGPDRAGRTDRRRDRNGEVFDGEIGASPQEGNEGGLGEDEQVLCGGERRDVEDRGERAG